MAFPGLFFSIFVFSVSSVDNKQMFIIKKIWCLEQLIFGIRGDRSANLSIS